LQKITDRLTIALKSGTIGSWEWDLVNNIGIWDERMFELYGVDKKSNSLTECEILANALHPDDRNSVETLLQQAILGEAEYDTEFRIVHSDSSIHFIKAYGVVVRDAQGNPQRMIGVNFDISDRKADELKLKESQQFLQTVLDTFPLSVFWKDRASVFLGCNQNLANDANLLSPNQIIGKTDYDLPWTKKESDLYRADDAEVINSGVAKLGIIETQYQADGSTIWLETNKIPLRNLNNEVIGILGTYQDISDRKLAEQKLKESQQFLQTLLDTLPVHVFWKNRESVFLGCNQTLAELMGLSSPEEFVQTTGHEFSYTDEELRDYQTDDQEVIASGQSKLMIEETMTLPNGKQISIETHKAPLRDYAGNITGVVGIFQDITDRKRMELELKRS
jgi:PAS domain S-box-containing protein